MGERGFCMEVEGSKCLNRLNFKDRAFGVTALALAIGLLLSIGSWFGVCTSRCTAAHLYRFWGFRFESLGILFFTLASFLNILSLRNPKYASLCGVLLAGAFGSELSFIYIQKTVIKIWCPVCLSIAACVACALISNAVQVFSGGSMFKNIKKFAIGLICAFLGLIVAMDAVAGPGEGNVQNLSLANEPVFGKKDSPVEVYVITDWLCPACQKIEKDVLQKMYPKMMEEAKIVFIDIAIHPESMNYTPYNLSFMLNNPDKYLALRAMLKEMAKQTSEPTQIQVKNAAAGLGVTYAPLNFVDIDKGLQYFKGIAESFHIDSAPTLVITNRKKLEAKTLEGYGITEDAIMNSIRELKN